MSPDEASTRAKLIEDPVDERPDAVLVVVDAANMARCLYLVPGRPDRGGALPYRRGVDEARCLRVPGDLG